MKNKVKIFLNDEKYDKKNFEINKKICKIKNIFFNLTK